jgi:hypothetical protein
MSGFIKLHRGWRDCEVFKDEPCTQREAWVWLLEHTAWKDCQRRDAQKALIEVNRGQFHTSIRNLAAAWQWSRGRVERFLNDLKTGHMIDHEAGHGGLLITICNYDKYQANEPSAGPTSGPSAGPSAGHEQGHTRRSNKKLEEEKNNTPLPPKGVHKPFGVSDEVWADWRRVRKKPITATVLKRMENEAAKIGWTLADAVNEAAESGWQGFKADWVKERNNGRTGNSTATAAQRALALIEIGSD